MDELLDLLRQALNLNEPIDADTALISSGLVDSFTAVGLLMELESHYGVIIEPDEIDAATLDTPRQILERLNRAA